MKVISVFNQKGGVGKTTTNINLCTYLAMKGLKVLTIDIDPQGNTTSGLGIDKSKLELSTYDALANNVAIDDIVQESQLIKNLYIAPSNVELAGAEVELINIENREKILKDSIKGIKEKYDYVFIDCPPSLGLITINSLVASDTVLIPIQTEFYALEGVGQLVNTIQLVKRSLNKHIEVEGVILTMCDTRTRLSNEVSEEVKKYFSGKLYKTTIPRNIRLAEAPSYGLPIVLYDNKCKGAECYSDLTDEFLSNQ